MDPVSFPMTYKIYLLTVFQLFNELVFVSLHPSAHPSNPDAMTIVYISKSIHIVGHQSTKSTPNRKSNQAARTLLCPISGHRFGDFITPQSDSWGGGGLISFMLTVFAYNLSVWL